MLIGVKPCSLKGPLSSAACAAPCHAQHLVPSHQLIDGCCRAFITGGCMRSQSCFTRMFVCPDLQPEKAQR